MATSAGQVLNLRGADTIRGVEEPRLRRERGPLPALIVQRSAEADVQAGHRYPLSAPVTLGRGPHNTIVLADRYVSKDHAIIYLQAGRHLLCDQNSTNGTYLNGARTTEPVPLANGDEISIGTTVFTYQAEE